MYGRRRLGKTALVKQSLIDQDRAVFYQARQKTQSLQIEQFINTTAETFSGINRIRDDWESLLGYLVDQDAIVVLDEFPYLVEEDSSLPSVLQAMYDHEVTDSSATIVLVGSSISMMEEAALLGNSPLYGRASTKLDIRQLPFDAAMSFFSENTADKQVLLWSIFGGTPYYLEEAAITETIGDAVQRTLLSQHGALHNDPDYVLRMGLTEPARYFSVLETVASGSTSRNEISQATGIDRNQLSKYLNRLERLRLIERHVPITEQKERSRRGRYRLRDQLFRFWFRFIYGTGSRYDDYGNGAFDTLIKPELADFASTEFERLCQHALWTLYPEETITDVGQWWYQEHEIDVVGLTNTTSLIAGECKFQSSPLGYGVFSKLKDHVDELRWTPPNGGERRCEYALFSRSGFKQSIKEVASEQENLQLFTVSDVVDALSNSGNSTG